ncbi:MAG: queuosine precursor transporter [Bacteroidales bacterium]|jgi:uncharacterized integral membrane protein (TIGR00697 family)|nr:queuosine precursor transporter [Bacteroidales bacterium]
MKEKVSVPYMIMGIIFNVCLITANLLETKLIQVGPLSITAGLLVFPISYIINDCITEIWGFKKARLIIWTGFIMNFFVAAMGQIATFIPAATYWEGGEHFNYIFGLVPRITIASLLAFICGSFVNSYIMSRMKIKSKGKRFSLRAIVSTIFGETIDSIIFFPIAFIGLIRFSDLINLILIQIALKSLYEILILPLTIRVIKYIKKIDGSDVYDDGISYNPLKIKDL